MKNEQEKDTLEAAAAASLAIAGAAGVAAAAIPGAVGIAFARFQERRSQKWWKLVVEGAKDPSELVARIEAGLADDDEHVIAGVVGGARAAASAVELAAISVIAELSRRFLHERDIPRWFYRAALALFEQLEASELGALRRLLQEIAPIQSDNILITGDIEGEAQPWRASQLSVPEPSQSLTPFLGSDRLFGLVKRTGLGVESPGMAFVGTPQHVVIKRDIAAWLREVMSPPAPQNHSKPPPVTGP